MKAEKNIPDQQQAEIGIGNGVVPPKPKQLRRTLRLLPSMFESICIDCGISLGFGNTPGLCSRCQRMNS
jgi:hypothetical protein